MVMVIIENKMQIVKYPDDTSYAIAKKLEQEYTEED